MQEVEERYGVVFAVSEDAVRVEYVAVDGFDLQILRLGTTAADGGAGFEAGF